MSKAKISLLFLGKTEDPFVEKARATCCDKIDSVTVSLGDWGEPLPQEAKEWKGDYIVSYLSRWIVPPALLESARRAAINFHPASPDYPGIGCFNFALYDGVTEYGTTCHHMQPEVDTGDIIAVQRFPVHPEDNVASLIKKTYAAQYQLFSEILTSIVDGTELPSSTEKWSRKPYSRKELDALGKLTRDMSEDEIQRRTRATTYREWGPVYVDE